MPLTVQFDKSINLFCLFLLTFKFLFSIYFLQLVQDASIITYNEQYFLTIKFIAFGFIIISDLSSFSNNLVEILLVRVFLVDCLMSKYLIDSFKNIKVSFVRVNSSKLKFLFYFFLPLYFVVNISVTVSIFIDF